MHTLEVWPQWLDLRHGVKVQFAQISRAALRKAARESVKVLRAAADPAGVDAIEAANDAYTASLLFDGILAWEGVGDAFGKAVAPTPETKAQFVADGGLFADAERVYTEPFLEKRAQKVAEKNASAGSPRGTSAVRTAARPTAKPAAKPARNAPTKKTPAKPMKARTPGRSSKPASGRSA